MNFATLIPLINLEGEHYTYRLRVRAWAQRSKVELVTAEK